MSMDKPPPFSGSFSQPPEAPQMVHIDVFNSLKDAYQKCQAELSAEKAQNKSKKSYFSFDRSRSSTYDDEPEGSTSEVGGKRKRKRKRKTRRSRK